VEGWARGRTKAEIAEALDGKVPFGPVNTAAEILADPHVKVREMLAEIEHPGSGTPVTVAGTPIRMTRTQGGVRSRAPLAGEHTDEVLCGAGMDADRLAGLRAAGVVG
jgi:crotonobetainyl-CoA:carnitine CoA-transferase CaiB-like acyl-CoA transferase